MILIFANKNAKMRFIGVLILALLLGPTSTAQTRRALVIGIGEYKDQKWPTIHGDNDIPIIVDMLHKNKFTDDNIYTLKNQEATFNNIKRRFNTLIKESRKGDIVYVHFSGHGQQISDLPPYDEKDGYDESYIAYDTPFHEEAIDYQNTAARNLELKNRLVDDTLYTYLSQIRDKIGNTGKLIFVNDACHSGSGNRGGDDSNEDIKSVRAVSKKLIIYNSGYCNPNNLPKKPYICTYIGACQDDEFVYEIECNGKLYGGLSWVLSSDSSLWETPLTLLEMHLKYKINEELKKINKKDSRNRQQTPLIECKQEEKSTNNLF